MAGLDDLPSQQRVVGSETYRLYSEILLRLGQAGHREPGL